MKNPMKGRTLLGKNEGEGRKIGLRRRTCLFACAVAFALTASGQNLRTQVTNFSVTNVTLKEALQQLEKQVDLGFFYESAEVAGVRGVTLHLGRTTVENVLAQLLNDRGFTYEVVDGNIVITRRPKNFVRLHFDKNAVLEGVFKLKNKKENLLLQITKTVL